MAGFCSIYKIYFNIICASTCPFFNANVRVTILYLRNILIDVISAKVLGELIKLVNK